MADPATELTHHDEDHGHYTDRPTLHDQLAAALAGRLTEMFRPEVGHSMTGDVCHLRDDARTLAQVAETVFDAWTRQHTE